MLTKFKEHIKFYIKNNKIVWRKSFAFLNDGMSLYTRELDQGNILLDEIYVFNWQLVFNAISLITRMNGAGDRVVVTVTPLTIIPNNSYEELWAWCVWQF